MSTNLIIDGELTVFAVHALKDRLMAAMTAMAEGDALVLDLGGVSEVDGAGIQLLLAARREAMQHGLSLRLGEVNTIVAEALKLIDLQTVFTPAPAAMEAAS